MESETVENATAESLTTVTESTTSSSSEVDKDKASGGGGLGGGQEENSSAEGALGGGANSLLGGVAVALERTDSVSSSDCRTPTTTTAKDKDLLGKINILLKPVGDAPILKQKLWAVPPERLISQIIEFVKKYLKLEKNQNLFIFVNQLFAPAPDQCVRDLYECFGSDRKLVLHYSTTIAWG